jgi:hypothetical protein
MVNSLLNPDHWHALVLIAHLIFEDNLYDQRRG